MRASFQLRRLAGFIRDIRSRVGLPFGGTQRAVSGRCGRDIHAVFGGPAGLPAGLPAGCRLGNPRQEALEDSGGVLQREQGSLVAASSRRPRHRRARAPPAVRRPGSARCARWLLPGGAPRSRRRRAGSGWSGRWAGRRRAGAGCRGRRSAAPSRSLGRLRILGRRPGATGTPEPHGSRGVRRNRARSRRGSSWQRSRKTWLRFSSVRAVGRPGSTGRTSEAGVSDSYNTGSARSRW